MSRAHAVLEVAARALAETPAAVRVEETLQRGGSLIEVFAAPDDFGRLIGRRGRTAAALRALAAAAAELEEATVAVEFRDGSPDGDRRAGLG